MPALPDMVRGLFILPAHITEHRHAIRLEIFAAMPSLANSATNAIHGNVSSDHAKEDEGD
jgi:hypothetical protein